MINLLRILSVWFANRLLQLGLIEDELLDVLLFNGAANMTTSRRSALAWKRETGEGRFGWGCIMCKYVLRWCVTKTHCADTLAGKTIPTPIAIKAWAFITLALGIIAAIPTCGVLWTLGVF